MAHHRPGTDRAQLLALFALAIGVRLLYILSTPPDDPIASVDAWGYHRLALNLDSGHGFSLHREAPFVPTSIRTPLYPAFLWLVRRLLGPSLRAAVIVQAILDGCTTILVWALSARVAGARSGRIAALLYALNPTQVRYVGQLLTETLLAFLLTLTMYALVRYIQRASSPSTLGSTGMPRVTWLVVAATFAGLSALCKPNVQFIPAVWLPAVVLLHRRHWHRLLIDLALLAATTSGVMLPWVVRNAVVFGRPFLSTAFEGNVSRVSAPAALAAARGHVVSPWSAEWDALFAEIVATTAERYGWDQPWDTLTARELDRHNHQVYLVAREVLLRHPAAWLGSHLQGLARYLEPQTYRVVYARFAGRDWPPDVLDDATLHVFRQVTRGGWGAASEIIAQERWHKLDVLQRTIWWATLTGQIIALVLMFAGAWRLRTTFAIAVALLLTIAYILWVPGPIAYERFRVPVTGLILVLVAGSSAPSTRPHATAQL